MLRSMLFVPADSERKLAKGEGAGADALILDLEDSVLPERKPLARGLAREYLLSHAQAGPLWIRVNDLASGELLKDLVSVVPARPAGIVLPKIRGPEDIQTVANYLDAFEASNDLSEASASGAGSSGATPSTSGAPAAILALVTETPAAVLRMGELVRATAPRLIAIGWGAEDLSSALGAGDPRLPNGAWRPMYEHARSQCLLAAHGLGVSAIDTVYVNYRDAEGLRLACEASRYDGFTGRFAIHPDQVSVINQAFTPSDAELALAHRIVEAFASGAGAVSLNGKMYDIPHLKAAQRLISSRAV
jgi:citrate lyase subunit beta/citryl-CoA lyase